MAGQQRFWCPKSYNSGGSLDIENYCTLRGAWPFEAPLISGRTARILK